MAKSYLFNPTMNTSPVGLKFHTIMGEKISHPTFQKKKKNLPSYGQSKSPKDGPYYLFIYLKSKVFFLKSKYKDGPYYYVKKKNFLINHY